MKKSSISLILIDCIILNYMILIGASNTLRSTNFISLHHMNSPRTYYALTQECIANSSSHFT